MHKFIHTLFVLLFTMNGSNLANAQTQQLVVWMDNGDKVLFDLEERPKTIFVANEIVITTDNISVKYPLSKVMRYTYVVSPTSISNTQDEEIKISQRSNVLTFENLKQDTVINVYALDGTLLDTKNASTETMRNRLFAIIMIIFSPLNLLFLSAQEENKVMYIHSKGGNLDVIFYSQVDSIVYSKMDTDSVMHEVVCTQEIWSGDSVLRIPLSQIDSISFQTPSTIYKKDAVILTSEYQYWISRCDSLTLFFRKDTPSGLLPQTGDKNPHRSLTLHSP